MLRYCTRRPRRPRSVSCASTAISRRPDGTLDVTETIHVRVENIAINHGIYRDLPTKYRATGGRRVKVGFQLAETWLDGQAEPNKVETLTNGVRIRIGSAERTVAPGEHIYTIRYRASRMIGRFDGYDELYWNATGNGWDFPIDRASATVTLPSPARFGQRAAYTGPQGSSESAARVTAEEPGKISFETTRPLYAREGLTIAVAFPKDVVAAPSESDRMGWFLSDWGPPIVGTLGLAGVLGYLFYAWTKAGRDPRPGTIVPLFSPPDDLSPGGDALHRQAKFDNRAFAAALVDAAVKGHVRLVEEDGGWFGGSERRIERYDMPGATQLAAPELAALNLLVSPNESLVMEQKNHATFSAAIKALGDRYAEAYDGKLFLRNYGWIGAAVVIFVAAFWLAAATVVLAEGAGSQLLVLLSGSGLAIGALIFHAAPKEQTSGRCLLHILALVFGELVSRSACRSFPRRSPPATGCRWRFRSWPAVRHQQLFLDVGTNQGRPRSARPDCRLQTISVDYRAGSVGPHAGAGRHAAVVRTLPALRYCAGRREPLGGPLHWFAGRGCGGSGRKPGLRLVLRVVEPVERYGRLRQFDRIVTG